jgi:hypothetical protein
MSQTKNVVRRVVLVAVAANIVLYAASIVAEVAREPSGGFLANARMMFTDELPLPINVWTCCLQFPGFLAAVAVLDAIRDRASWGALFFPQLAFVVVSSLQTAAVAWWIARLAGAAAMPWRMRARAAMRRLRHR